MDRTQVEKSHRTWQTLIRKWDGLDRLLFDRPTEPQWLNLKVYLEELNESISYQFGILEFVLGFYGSVDSYMRRSSSDSRSNTDYFCSENNLLSFRTGFFHFEEPEIKDMERLLRYYLLDTEQQQEIDAKPPQTA